MKSFIAFVRKEFYHILRDRRTLLILFAMPIAQVLIFGYTVTNEFKDAPIAIVDQAKDDLSRELSLHLTASGHFLLKRDLNTIDHLESAFRAGDIKMAVIIPPDFESGFYRDRQTSLQFIADGAEPNYAETLTQYATQMVRSFQRQWGSAGPESYQVSIDSRMIYNPMLVSSYNFIPGVISIILLLISAMMTSLTIAKEKEQGTMDLLLVSPLNPMVIILGKVAPYVLISMINAIIVLVMGYFIFSVPIKGSLLLLLGLCLLYVFTALSLGLLISTRSSTQQAAMMGSLFSLMMPSMLLSGFLFPIESMPWLLQHISTIIPATYFIDILKGVMLKGTGLSFIWWPTLVLVIMTLVLLIASWRSFKVRSL